MFSLVTYGPLWPCSPLGRSRERVLDILPRLLIRVAARGLVQARWTEEILDVVVTGYETRRRSPY